MTPYVEFQQSVIRILFRLAENDQGFLRRLIDECRKQTPEMWILNEMISLGLGIPRWCRATPGQSPKMILAEIILEQLDDSGSVVVVRNLLGSKLYNYGQPLSLAQFVEKKGSGECRLRTNRLSQPGALKEGDVLADGSRVLSEPREGGNGSVLIHLTQGLNGAWMGVPARIPIALLTEEDGAPEGLVDE